MSDRAPTGARPSEDAPDDPVCQRCGVRLSEHYASTPQPGVCVGGYFVSPRLPSAEDSGAELARLRTALEEATPLITMATGYGSPDFQRRCREWFIAYGLVPIPETKRDA